MTVDNSGQLDYVRALTAQQFSWTGGTGTAVSPALTYSFDKTKLASGGTGADTMDSTQQAAVVAALQAWADVAGLVFTEDDTAPKIVFVVKSLIGMAGETASYTTGSQLTHADVFIDEGDFGGGYNPGQDGFHTILHEIGHALGGSHPGGTTAAAGSNPAYNRDGTAMSYNPGAYATGLPYASTPMAYDIALMQFLYGANATGNSTTPHYINGSYTTIATLWDYDGSDSIEVSGSGYSASLDLREGPAYHSQVNTNVFFIAYGANIDKAVGGGSADTIVGNGRANSLSGGAGNDTITPGAGNDTVTTGSNNDTVVFEFNPTDTDTITDFSLGNDALDLSRLGVFASTLQADATESSGTTTLHISGMDIVVTGVTKTDLFNPSNAAFTGLIGGTAGNNLIGNGSNNTISLYTADINSLYATANNDTLTGNGGNDALQGSSGSDTYVFNKGDGNDTITEVANTGHSNILKVNAARSEVFLWGDNNDLYVTVNDGTDRGRVLISNEWGNSPTTNGWYIKYIQTTDAVIDLSATTGNVYSTPAGVAGVFNSRADYAAPDTLLGGNGNDFIVGTGGNNVVNGGIGNDYLYGQGGADTLTGGKGNDTYYGGAGSDTFVFNKDDGIDTVSDSPSSGDTNVLRINANLSELFLWGDNNDLWVSVHDGADRGKIRIANEWGNTPTTNGWHVKTIEANDGSIDLSTTAGLTYSTPAGVAGTFNSRADYAAPDTLLGGNSNDFIVGTGGNNVVNGGSGNDYLYGQGGADTLTGGAGNDIHHGGTGNDVYVFGTGDGHDAINDTSGSSVLQIGSYHHYTDSGYDRTYYKDNTNTDYITINGWYYYSGDWTIA